MLQLKAIHTETFALLKEMAALPVLANFALAGGTALALQLGHRISIDLDFFTEDKFDGQTLSESLGDNFVLQDISTGENSLSCWVNYKQRCEVKLDLVRHKYRLLKPHIIVGDIQIYSVEDIAAMKLNAVANRGAKKDFYDIHALMGVYSLPELLDFFEKKYRNINSFTVVKSLTYFDDADIEPDPVSLNGMSWNQIKGDIVSNVKNGIV